VMNSVISAPSRAMPRRCSGAIGRRRVAGVAPGKPAMMAGSPDEDEALESVGTVTPLRWHHQRQAATVQAWHALTSRSLRGGVLRDERFDPLPGVGRGL